jgi:ribosomal-protein-serine acetyltransferase
MLSWSDFLIAGGATRQETDVTAANRLPQTPLFESLEGPRVVIRPFSADDAEALHQAIAESRDRLARWLPWAAGHQTVDETREVIGRLYTSWKAGEGADVGVFSRDGGRLLGGIGLHPRDWDVPSYEIGYWLRTSAEGHGYISEAAALLTGLAATRLGANRVEIRCDVRNLRSAAVAERLGFVREGLLRNQARTPTGGLRDTLVFALTPADPRWPRQP